MRTTTFITAVVALTASANAWLPNTETHALNDHDNEIFVYPLRTEPNNKRWVPAAKKIRGVNLGSLFIFEPWIDSQEWANSFLHGAPGAQEPNQPFTGQYAPTVGFYSDQYYERAIEWLEWMTDMIHTKKEYRNVGMLELVNEPLNWDNAVASLRKTYYPKAYSAIRKVEDKLKVTSNNRLHIQMMGSLWGSGKPTEFLSDTSFTAFDDHRYLKWDTSVEASHEAYIEKSCSDDRNTDGPTIVGEWSLAVPDDVEKTNAWNPHTQKGFYTKRFSAQVHAYEKHTLGWVFWTWKANLGDDYRWSYRGELQFSKRTRDY
ncbi:SPR1-exo-1,3-beta-glucanase precursor [Fusarium fujikuroi]|nr:SPR1-exo-1,3-beta-glucanase precursor [Fusarium fujikuroi]SCV53393.1 related to SPR1-exo-1,3-beta-glucanase precursor [Fusarium fujikuroi]